MMKTADIPKTDQDRINDALGFRRGFIAAKLGVDIINAPNREHFYDLGWKEGWRSYHEAKGNTFCRICQKVGEINLANTGVYCSFHTAVMEGL